MVVGLSFAGNLPLTPDMIGQISFDYNREKIYLATSFSIKLATNSFSVFPIIFQKNMIS